jgi:hypothetical protein
MEALAEGLEGRPYRAEVLAMFAPSRRAPGAELLHHIETRAWICRELPGRLACAKPAWSVPRFACVLASRSTPQLRALAPRQSRISPFENLLVSTLTYAALFTIA